MNLYPIQSKLRHLALAGAAIAVPLTMQACRPKDDTTGEKDNQSSQALTSAKEELTKNQSSFISAQTSSPIAWKNWHKDLFKDAAKEKKTVFAFIGSGTDPNALLALDRINGSPAICSTLNNNHVNVLIDSNIHPDIEFLAASLCLKTRTAVVTPLLVWFSYEGHPISWSPVGTQLTNEIAELVGRMSGTIYNVWNEDPEYVLKNSSTDFKNYMDLSGPQSSKATTDFSGIPLKATQKASSLFDPTSDTIDSIGNLSAARYIDLMVSASHHRGSSKSQRERYLEIASLAADRLLIRGLIDPLDGGVFSGIQHTTHALPRFTKTLRAQALSMGALYDLYQANKDPRYLAAADSIGDYSQKNLSLDDGGYIFGITHQSDKNNQNACIWSFDEIEAALSQKEFQVARIAFGLEKRGNIPLIDDPGRFHFRKNSLIWKVTLQQLATRTAMDATALTQTLEAITNKLAKLRAQKTPKPFVEKLTTSGSTALFASAYVSGYRATGKPAHLDQAKKSLNYIREHFIDQEGKLHRASFNGSLNSHPATGSDHTLVCQAALDLHEVTLDPAWLKFAQDIHNRMNQTLADDNNYHIKEYDGTGYPKHYDVSFYYTIHALDNDSTWGLAYANAKRLSLRLADDTLSKQIQSLEGILMRSSLAAPAACTDFLTGEAMANTKRIYITTPASPELLATASKYPCQIIAVTDEGAYPELGPEAAKLTAGAATVVASVAGQGKTIGSASSAAELDALLK